MCDRVYSEDINNIGKIIQELIYNYKSPLIHINVNNTAVIYSGYKGEICRIKLKADKIYLIGSFKIKVTIATYRKCLAWVEKKFYTVYISSPIDINKFKGKIVPLDNLECYA